MGFVPLILVVIVLVPLVWLELRRYGRARLEGQVSDAMRARLGRRLLSAALLFIVTALVGFGFEFRTLFQPSQLVGYFLICGLLLCLLVGTMVYDIRAVVRQSLLDFHDRDAEAERFQAFMARDGSLPQELFQKGKAGGGEPGRTRKPLS
ncbi:MAG: hypothetical protein ACUVR8_07345 [Acidobacteriota bacterium]